MAARKKSKKENLTEKLPVISAGLTTIEMKLLRLALDKAAYDGEAENAAVMLVRKLRERSADADELFGHAYAGIPEPSPPKQANIGSEKMTFGKYKGEKIKDVPVSYLFWVMQNCTNINPKLKSAIHQFLEESQ